MVGAGTHPGPGVPGVIASAEIVAKQIPDCVIKSEHDPATVHSEV